MLSEVSRPQPVLMIPLRRCGSHALRLRLNFSPDFYSPYPLHLVDFMPLLPLYGDLSNDQNYFQLVVDLLGLQTASLVKWSDVVLDPISLFDSIKERPRSIHTVAWEMLLQAGVKHHAKIVMDKSLDNVHYADDLISLFPDLRFLNVVRDPRAQISSMTRAIIHDFDPLLNALTWTKAYEAAARLEQKYPQKVLTIRFEDFLADQQTVLRQVCGFFGIAFLPTMLDVSSSQEARKISGRSALWESNAAAPIAANADKFKKSLSMEDIEVIETIAGKHMERYGYEKMTKGAAKITPQKVMAARRRSEKNKKLAWEALKSKDYRDYRLRLFRSDYIEMVKKRLLQDKRISKMRTALRAAGHASLR
jgi:sulfotransferase family protein